MSELGDLVEYTSNVPSGYITKALDLTRTLALTTTVTPQFTLPLATISSIITVAQSNQDSAFSALKTISNTANVTSLFNAAVNAQATLNYYSLLQEQATQTSLATETSFISKVAQASAVMNKVVYETPFYGGNPPNISSNGALVAIFLIFCILHLILGIFYRQTWFLVCWVIGLFLEVIGYIGRVLSSRDIMGLGPYIMQSTCITIAPTLMMAGIYYIVGQVTVIYGQQYSLLKATRYSKIFIFCDVVSFLTQSAGGGLAATASNGEMGRHLLLAGLAFQTVSMVFFQFLWFYLIINIFKAWRSDRVPPFNPEYLHIRERGVLPYFIVSVSIAVMLIFVRSIYRLAELAEGWDSKLIIDERYFMVLEALMIVLATFCMTVLHPGLAYGRNANLVVKNQTATIQEDAPYIYPTNKDYDYYGRKFL